MSIAFSLFHFALLISQTPCRAATVSRTVVDFLPYATIGRIVNMHKSSLGPNVLKDNLNQQSSFKIVNAYTSESTYKFISTTSEASKVFNQGGDFALRTGLGLSPSGGSVSGTYFKSSLNRDNFAELLFNINVKTHTHSLANYRDALNMTRCSQSSTEGTHIVTGIQFGASCIISLRMKAETLYEKESATGDAKAMFDISLASIEAEGSLKELTEHVKKMANVPVYTFCNLHLDSFPSTPVEGIKLVESFLERMAEENKDGVPIQMELTHLSEFPECAAKGKTPWQNSNSLTAYFDETTELLEDVTVAYQRLWACSEILTESSDSAKQDAKLLREKMKRVNYDLREFIANIDPKNGPQQFKRLHQIYGAGNAVNLYDHNHWRVKVHKTCHELKKLPRMAPPIQKATSKNCKHHPQLAFFAGTVLDGRLKRVAELFDGSVTQYILFNDDPWFVSFILNDNTQVTSIEIVFDTDEPPEAGMEIDVYFAEEIVKGVAFTKDISSLSKWKLKHSGKIIVPKVTVDRGPEEKLRSIKIEMEKNTNSQKVVRLQGKHVQNGKRNIRIAEVFIAGKSCTF